MKRTQLYIDENVFKTLQEISNEQTVSISELVRKAIKKVYMKERPTDADIILPQEDKITIMDYDGNNRRTAYAGPFWDAFAVPWASGGKIVILTNLNSAASVVNNLYVVNLR